MLAAGLGLWPQRNTAWWPGGASYAADFVNNRYMRQGAPIDAASAYSLTRASSKWALDSAAIWRNFPADTPARTDLGLSLEPAGTNLVLNPNLAGAVVGVVGAGGSLPTGWYTSGVLPTEVVALTTLAGLPAIRLRVAGVAAGTFFELGAMPSSTPMSALTTYSASIVSVVHAGAAPTIEIRQATDSDAFVAANAFTPTASTSITRSARVFSTLAATTRARLRFTQTVAVGVAYSFEFTLACPQVEAGGFVTSPLLASRASDALTLQLPPRTFTGEGAWDDLSTTNYPGAVGSYPFTTTLPRSLLRRTSA